MRKLIALGGPQRAGKDASGDYLEEHHGFVKMGMSDALNDALLVLNPWIKPDFRVRVGFLWVKQWEVIRYRDLHDAVGYVEAKRHREVRELLQLLGTEVGRDMIDPNVWVNIAEKKIYELWNEGKDVVITAIRFPNELKMVSRLGGISAWIDRSAELRGVPEDVEQHASDTSVSSVDFHTSVDNNGTLDNLRARLDWLVSLPTEMHCDHQGEGFWQVASNTFDDTQGWPDYDR